MASSVRSIRNTLVPIRRMPLELFSLIPHHWRRRNHWDGRDADRDLISMTHVCRSCKEILTSHCSSLWTHSDFQDTDKTRVYIERSRSLPLNITLFETSNFDYCADSFLEAVPHLDRLGSLTMLAHLDIISELCSHLPSPAVALKELNRSL